MKKAKITEFAEKNGYDGAEYIGEWNGFKCYEPYFDGDDITAVGLPLLILVDKDENIRMSTPAEALQQLQDSEGGDSGD